MAFFTALAAALSSYLVTLGVSAAVAGIASSLIVGIGAQLVSATLFRPRQPSAPSTKYQAVINQAAAERVRAYGRVKLGGPRAFWDQKDGKLFQVVLLHTGRISSIERIWIGDKAVTLDANGNVTTAPFVDYVQIVTRLGLADAVVYSALSDTFPIKWTADHRLRGISSAFVRFQSPPLEDLQKVFPESYNTAVTFEVKASEVYDPRSDAVAWNDNAGLCTADYLIHPDGFQGIERDDLDWDTVGTFSNTCGQLVDKADGSTERRYRLWGAYSLEDEGKAVLERMAKTCDLELYLTPEGRIGFRGGKWTPPTVVLDEACIVSYTDLVQGADRLVTFNELRVTYVDPQQDYQTTEADPWVNESDQAKRGRIVADFDADMAPSPSQARRLAKIHAHKENPEWQGSITTNLLGLNAINERIVTVRISELGIDMPFLVDGWGINIESGKPVGATFQIRSLTANAYGWDPATEEGTAAADVEDDDEEEQTQHPDVLPVPVQHGSITLNAQNQITISFEQPTGRPDLRLYGRFRQGTGPWMAMTRDDYQLVTPTVPGGQTYTIRARWIDAGNGFGPETDAILFSTP